MPYCRILISPQGEDLCDTLLAHGGAKTGEWVRFDAPNRKYLLFFESKERRDAMVDSYAETNPEHNFTTARFYYFEYNEPGLLIHLRPLVASHPDLVVDAGPDTIEPTQVIEPLRLWLDARAKGGPNDW